MKNILKVLFVLLFAIVMIASCTPNSGNNGNNANVNNGGWNGVMVAYYRGISDLSIANLENRFLNET